MAKNVATGLGEVILTERTFKGENISMLVMSTNQFDNLINFHWESFRKLDKESLIYKYFDRDYISGDEKWAVDIEMKIENISEFINHLENIDKDYQPLDLVKKEYKAVIDFCKKILNNNAQLYFIADDY